MSATFQRLFTPVLIMVAALVASTFLVAPSADAMSVQTRSRVVHVAASKAGTPYRYGASGPSAFDCSGFTRWVYAKVGRHLPGRLRGFPERGDQLVVAGHDGRVTR